MMPIAHDIATASVAHFHFRRLDEHPFKMASNYLRQWRKRKAQIDELVQSSDDENQSEELNNGLTDASNEVEDSPPHNNAEGDADFLQFGYADEYLLSSESEELDSNDEEENVDLASELNSWHTKHNCNTRESLNDLLCILRKQGHQLPKDARTVLNTPRTVPLVDKCNGQYKYFGIKTGILHSLDHSLSFDNDAIELCINIDGLPLFKSVKGEFWPILCKFDRFEPFVVALFFGTGKPFPVEDYCSDFLEELRTLQQDGLTHNEKSYRVKVKCFVCDAPARAFLKCVRGHNSTFGCERCQVQGVWEGRIVYRSGVVAAARTDQAFADFVYRDHQKVLSPLADAGVLCVSQFSLDYMHLVCLGTVKRMMCFWQKGPASCRVSARHLKEVSENLEQLQGRMPSEFARQPRSLLDKDRWKATEFRQFLLYTGPIVLKGVLSEEVYNHFMTLSVALSILLESNQEKRTAYLQYARDLLDDFVEMSQHIYGPAFTVYNIHSLTHLYEDVQNFGCSLNDISAFPFENFLYKLKRLVKNRHNPIAQVTKRMKQLESVKTVQTEKFRASTTPKDSCFVLHNEDYAVIREIREDGKLLCDIIPQRKGNSFYTRPCHSTLLNIIYVRNHERTASRLLKRKDLNRKAIRLPYHDGHNQGHVIFPLLHELERLQLGNVSIVFTVNPCY